MLVIVITLTVKSFKLFWIETFYHENCFCGWVILKKFESFWGWPNFKDFKRINFCLNLLFKTLKSKEDKKMTYVNEEKNEQKKFPGTYL